MIDYSCTVNLGIDGKRRAIRRHTASSSRKLNVDVAAIGNEYGIAKRYASGSAGIDGEVRRREGSGVVGDAGKGYTECCSVVFNQASIGC